MFLGHCQVFPRFFCKDRAPPFLWPFLGKNAVFLLIMTLLRFLSWLAVGDWRILAVTRKNPAEGGEWDASNACRIRLRSLPTPKHPKSYLLQNYDFFRCWAVTVPHINFFRWSAPAGNSKYFRHHAPLPLPTYFENG